MGIALICYRVQLVLKFVNFVNLLSHLVYVGGDVASMTWGDKTQYIYNQLRLIYLMVQHMKYIIHIKELKGSWFC